MNDSKRYLILPLSALVASWYDMGGCHFVAAVFAVYKIAFAFVLVFLR